MDRLKLLAQLIYDPRTAIARLHDRAPYLAALLLCLLASALYTSRLTGLVGDLRALLSASPQVVWRIRFLFLTILPGLFEQVVVPLLFLCAFLVPGSILIVSILRRDYGFGRALRSGYRGLVSVVLYAWAAAQLVVALPALLLFNAASPYYEAALLLAPLPYFGLVVIMALRLIYRLSFGRAAFTAVLGLVAVPMLLAGPLFILSAVPVFVLFWVILLLRGYLSELWAAQRARARFEQSLAAATLNPADAGAHYNLGRIYQQRGQVEEAIASFLRAIEIDEDELDAHYQLGQIAREQRRYQDAIRHFDAVVRRDLDYSQSEIWREVGATYFAAGQYGDACVTLERFLGKRPSDAEGRYRYGMTLYRLGRREESLEQMRAVIEAVQSAPAYKYRSERRWMIEAQSFLRSQAA